MFKTKKTRVIGLVLVAALILVGAVYATAAWAAPIPHTGRSTAASTATTTAADTAQLRATVLEMLEDHMGLDGP